jgi:uncharacterized protein with PIN domain
MVIDTSAIFAAVVGEADSGLYRNAIVSAPLRIISAITLLETEIVLFSRSGGSSIVILHELIRHAGIAIAPFDSPTAEAAFDAFQAIWQRTRSQSAAQHPRLRRLCARQDARSSPAL